MIRVGPGHVVRTVDVLRSCGRGRRECVVYWLAAVATSADVVAKDMVAKVVHPVHTSSVGAYNVEGRWLTTFFLRLSDAQQRVVAQVHSHPGGWTEHSSIDDEFVLVPSPGFVSIVVPNFGMGPVNPTTWNIQVLGRSGSWRPERGAIEW